MKKHRPNSSRLPSSVDGIENQKDIAGHFMEKFESLYNIVGYDQNEMNVLKNDINCAVNRECILNGSSNNLLINPDSIRKGINKLKLGKNDGSLPLTSENLIYATDIFHGHLSLLFSTMLRHGHSPKGMLMGTMVPLPKGRWNDLSNSKNFRALTISSLLGKLLDNVILDIESQKLKTNDL